MGISYIRTTLRFSVKNNKTIRDIFSIEIAKSKSTADWLARQHMTRAGVAPSPLYSHTRTAPMAFASCITVPIISLQLLCFTARVVEHYFRGVATVLSCKTVRAFGERLQ